MQDRFKDEWERATPEQRIQRCKSMAAEAYGLADVATGERRDAYRQIAREWLKLAAEIENNGA